MEPLREADLVPQPAAIILLLLQILLQLHSLSFGRAYRPLGFHVVVSLSIKQVLPLCEGGSLFPEVLVGLGKLLDGKEGRDKNTNTSVHILLDFKDTHVYTLSLSPLLSA